MSNLKNSCNFTQEIAMDVFGIIGMSVGLLAFMLVVNLTKKVDELEKRLQEIEDK